MKVLTYKYDDMARAGQLLNNLVVTGTSNCRIVSAIADILDGGSIGEIVEMTDKETQRNGNMGIEEMEQDKLEKPSINGNRIRSDKSK